MSRTDAEPTATERFERLVDLGEAELRQPGEVYDALRAEGPVVWVERLQSFVVSDYDVAGAVLTDHERYRSGLGHPTGPLFHDRDEEVINRVLADSPELVEDLQSERATWTERQSLLDADPPLHTHQKQLVNRIFSPKNVRDLEGSIATIANELVDRMLERTEVELVSDYAKPFPLLVIAHQMGVDVTKLDDFSRWSNDFVAVIGNDKLTEDDFRSIVRSRLEFYDYFVAEIDDRRANPQDDLLTMIAVSDDMDGNLISYADALRYLAQFLAAGHETTTNMLAKGLLMITENDELATRLIEDPSIHERFTEEALRLSSPVQGLYRTAAEDTELAGTSIPAGSFVLVLYAAANLDPGTFECPHAVDFERPNPRGHVAFGKGIHHCIGAPLARAEGRIGFATILERFYPWRLSTKPDAVRWRKSFILNGPEAIHVVKDPAATTSTAVDAGA